MNETGNDFLPILSSVPGPRGPKGDPGAGAAGAAGRQPFTLTTSVFTVPAKGATVGISVGDTAMFAAGLSLFVEGAGFFQLTAIPNATTLTLLYLGIPANSASGQLIPAGRKVVAAGPSYIDTGALDDLGSRVNALELTPGGNRNFYAPAAPASTGLKVGDNWYDTDDGHKHYRWDGTAWVVANRILDQADFGTGIRPIVKVSSLPTSGYADGDYVHLTTDGKLYRRVAGVWTKAIATGDLVGQIPGAMIVDGTIIAQKIGAGAISADHIGANLIVTSSANIGSAVINDAHITQLGAGKITAGDIQTVNIGYAGRIFHPSYIGGAYAGRYFGSVEMGTSSGDGHLFNAAAGFAFSQCAPVKAYGPGHLSWGLGGAPTCAPDSAGKAKVHIQASLIGHDGLITLYLRKNGGAAIPLASVSSDDAGNARLGVMRQLTGIAATDMLDFYVAPCDGAGAILGAVTCRYELDVTFFNW